MISLLDPMTGLFNRRGFYHKMEQILHDERNMGKYLYIFSIDMNRLKYINDNFGHAEGDFAITTLANALSKAAGACAICTRFGGDEFIVALLDDSSTHYSIDDFRQQMFCAIAETEGVSQKPYHIEASIGKSCKRIVPAINIENMIAIADESMYQMKQQK